MLLLHLPVKRNDLNSWVAGLAGNTALVSTASHLDVSGITPASSPGVLDDPVGTIVGISTVSDGNIVLPEHQWQRTTSSLRIVLDL